MLLREIINMEEKMKKVKDAEYEEKVIEEEVDEEDEEDIEIYSPKKKKAIEAKKYEVDKPRKPKKNYEDIVISVFITFVICLIIGFLAYNFYFKDRMINNGSNQTTKIQKDITVTDKGIADAVEKVYDSVVTIETYVKETAYASGTGFVFKTEKDNAYIMTNHHVIANATAYKVTFTNNKTVEAKLVGSDEYSDIAILAVKKSDIIQVAQIGSSSEMRVGDTTFAVGAPLDAAVYSWSVTRGILSGKNRLVEVSSQSGRGSFIMEVLQTDTAINSGNSGGPLCNSNGEVIGVTNMKLSSSSIEGMGFAIPIDDAVTYADSIISGKGIARPYLGVTLSDTQYSRNDGNNSFWFFNWGSAAKKGVFIQTVEQGSPAAKAGIQSGDRIVKVNDKEVEDVSHFKYELYKYQIGEEINLTIERNEKQQVVKVKLASNLEVS